MKFSYREIIESLPTKKNSNSSWWVKLWVRKASFLFTYLFINLGFSPNGVSIISIFVSITSCILFMIPEMYAVVLAVFLVNFWLILDCVDGNIARCLKNKTAYGEFVDDISGYYTVGFIYLAIGVCAYNFGGLLFEKYNSWLIVIGAVSSICDILARLIHKDFEKFTDKTLTESERQKKNSLESYDVINKKSLSYLRRRVGKELGVSGFFMPLSILCLYLKFFDLMTLFYLIFNISALLVTTAVDIYKANKYDETCPKDDIHE